MIKRVLAFINHSTSNTDTLKEFWKVPKYEFLIPEAHTSITEAFDPSATTGVSTTAAMNQKKTNSSAGGTACMNPKCIGNGGDTPKLILKRSPLMLRSKSDGGTPKLNLKQSRRTLRSASAVGTGGGTPKSNLRQSPRTLCSTSAVGTGGGTPKSNLKRNSRTSVGSGGGKPGSLWKCHDFTDMEIIYLHKAQKDKLSTRNMSQKDWFVLSDAEEQANAIFDETSGVLDEVSGVTPLTASADTASVTMEKSSKTTISSNGNGATSDLISTQKNGPPAQTTVAANTTTASTTVGELLEASMLNIQEGGFDMSITTNGKQKQDMVKEEVSLPSTSNSFPPANTSELAIEILLDDSA
jgi:hypothetical protein